MWFCLAAKYLEQLKFSKIKLKNKPNSRAYFLDTAIKYNNWFWSLVLKWQSW